MKKSLLLLLFLVSFKGFAQNYNDLKMEQRAGTTTICYANEANVPFYVPPPRAYFDAKRGRVEGVDIQVKYTNFTPEAQKAFQFAVDIWKSLITSPVTIQIDARWESIADANVLGQASTTSIFRNFTNTPRPFTWYPIALAEKLAGRDLNGAGSPDVRATFNANNKNWYFGADGNVPTGKYSLVSVVLHEIAHGIGFVDSFGKGVATNAFLWGDDTGMPFIYDTYLETIDRIKLVDTLRIKNNSVALGNELKSNALFFGSALAEKRNGKRIKIYSPRTYDDGSSISHLDTDTYSGTTDGLMTHAIPTETAILDPGKIVLDIFSDIGWNYTYIAHATASNTEELTKPIPITASILSDSTLNLTGFTLQLHYSEDRFQTKKVLQMVQNGTKNEFTASIPALITNKRISYHIEAKRADGLALRAPATAPFYYEFNGSSDEKPPILKHDPLSYILDSDNLIKIEANADDELSGVDSVLLEYSINGGQVIRQALTLSNRVYSTEMRLGTLRGGNTVNYRLTAIDRATSKNKISSPKTDFHTYKVVEFKEAVKTYNNDFNAPSDDFVGKTYSINTPTGFDNGTLNSEHPYQNGLGVGDESNFSVIMTRPITVSNESGFAKIAFDEVVLVEPGERTAVFGQAEFYDYVVVEGSNDKGKTWTPLENGYDSRNKTNWFQRFYSDTLNNNSRATGNKTLIVRRTMPLNRFKAGDNVLLRFRLFADQAVYGWGWAIDNLNIQDQTVGIADDLITESFQVYPNPSKGTFRLQTNLLRQLKEAKISVINLLGATVWEQKYQPQGLTFVQDITLPTLAAGVYQLRFETEKGMISRKIVIEK